MKKLISAVAVAAWMLGGMASAHANVTYTEDFEAAFPAWESGWFGANSNALNLYCPTRGCTDRGNNPDGLWLKGTSGGMSTSPIQITFDKSFGESLLSISLDVASYTSTTLAVVDSDGVEIFSALTPINNGAYTDPGTYAHFTINSTNGIGGFSFSGSASGYISIDNLVAVAKPASPPAPQTITFTSAAPTNATVGGATYEVDATGGGSSNPVVFSIDSSATGICSISGSTVSFLTPGSCVVNANQAGDTSYLPAPQQQQSFAVSPAPLTPQAITFTSTPPTPAIVGQTYEATVAGGSSGEPVILAVAPAASAICSITGSTVSFLSEGDCVIIANQAGNATHQAAPQVEQSFVVSAAPVIPPVPVATPVPTLSQWGLMLLASMLGGLAFWRQRRKS